VINWVSPCLSFFFSASTAATNIFIAPTCTNTIITLDPSYALNAKFQHFIPRFNKIFLVYWYTFRGVWRWKEAQRQGDVRNNLSIYTYASQNIYMRSCTCIWQIFTLASCTCQQYIRLTHIIYTTIDTYMHNMKMNQSTNFFNMENFHVLRSLRNNQMKNWLISDLCKLVTISTY
jgi:hypothetical protein